jgi:acetyl esterase/lipase
LLRSFEPRRIAISGDSAGGGLTFAVLLALKKHGDPMPACAVPLSPWVDLEGLGDSMTGKDAEDPMVHKPMIEQMGKTYVGTGNVRDPLAAPLYGDLRGLPPLLIQVGSRETLLDDAVRMTDKAKKAGVDVELDVWEGQIHVWQIFASRLDEGEKAIQKIGAFVHKHTG